MKPNPSRLTAVIALCMFGSVAGAQEMQQDNTQQDVQENVQDKALKGIEPVVPAGPAVVPVRKTTTVRQVGPAVVPVVPVEKLEGVETVTLDTAQGPVVVISYPGTVPSAEYNIDFSALDGNDDGYISREESKMMAGRSGAAHNLDLEFKIADKNADNRLAFTEIIEWVY